MSDSLEVSISAEVMVCKLNRPEVRNALNLDLVKAMLEALNHAENESAINAVVITGSPPSFCSGGDLSDVSSAIEPAALAIRHRTFVKLVDKIARLPKPVIAGVNGRAIGAGAALALACDYVVATKSAILSFPFVSIGLPPDFLSAAEIVRRSGSTVARDLIYSGRSVQSDEAISLRLIDDLCDEANFMERVLFEAKRLGALSGFAFSLAKDAIRNSNLPRDAAVDIEPLAVAAAAASSDFRIVTERFHRR